MGGYYDEIEIEDMTWDDTAKVFHYPCPCGDRFEISRGQLANYEDIATCPSCSLIIRVIYDPLDYEDYEEEEDDEDASSAEDSEPKEKDDDEETTAPTKDTVASDSAHLTSAIANLNLDDNAAPKSSGGAKDADTGAEMNDKDSRGLGSGMGLVVQPVDVH